MVAKYLCSTLLNLFVPLADSVTHLHFKRELHMLVMDQMQSYFNQLMTTDMPLESASTCFLGQLCGLSVVPAQEGRTWSNIVQYVAYMAYVASVAFVAVASVWQVAGIDK